MADNEVSVEITLEEKKALSSIKSIENALNAFASKSTKSISTMDIAFGSFVGTIASSGVSKALELATSAFTGLVNVAWEGALAAAEDQKAFDKFNYALALNGKYSKEASDQFAKFASNLEETQNIADGTVATLGSMVASMTNLGENSIERVIQAGANLSVVMGKDLESSVQAVVKAINGQDGGLEKLGIQLDTTKDRHKNLEIVLGELEKRFSGASENSIKTFEGSLKQATTQVGNIKEEMGNALINGTQMQSIFELIAESAKTMQAGIKDNSLEIHAFLGTITTLALDGTNLFLQFADVIYRAFTITFNSITVTLRTFSLAFYASIEGINQAIAMTVGLIDRDMGNSIAKGTEFIRKAMADLKASIDGDYKDIDNAFSKTSGISKIGDALGNLSTKMQENMWKHLETVNSYKNGEGQKTKITQEELMKRQQLEIDAELAKLQLVDQRTQYSIEKSIEERTLKGELALQEYEQLAQLEQEKLNLIYDSQAQKAQLLKDDAEKMYTLQKIQFEREKALLIAKGKFENEQNKRISNQKEKEDAQTLESSKYILSQGLQLAKEGSVAQKALSITQATISTYEAANKALTAGPIIGPILAGVITAMGMANVAKISGAKFATGGIVGGTSYSGDKVPVRVNSQEMILNRQQQTEMFRQLNGGGSSNSNLSDAINSLGDRIASMNIVVHANSREIARLVREENKSGFSF